MRTGRTVLFFLLLAAAAAMAQTRPSTDTKTTAPAATLDRAYLYLDRSSLALDRFRGAFGRGDQLEADNALREYTREFSQFHVVVTQLRLGKRDRQFATRVLKSLESQVTQLESLDPIEPAKREIAIREAIGHIKSALPVVKANLDSQSRSSRLKVRGAGSEVPGVKPK